MKTAGKQLNRRRAGLGHRTRLVLRLGLDGNAVGGGWLSQVPRVWVLLVKLS